MFGSMFKKNTAAAGGVAPGAGMAAPGNNLHGTSIAAQNGAPNSALIPEGNSEKQVVLMGLVHKKQKWRGQWVERFFQVEDTKLTYKYPMNKVGTAF